MRIPGSELRAPFSATMTPMIDVVFLLIIFFLVSSHLARREAQIPMEPPTAATGTAAHQAASYVTLQMDRDGVLWWNGTRIAPVQLEQHFQEQTAQDGAFDLRLRCDRQLAYRDVERVLLAATRAGIWNVSFTVLHAPRNH